MAACAVAGRALQHQSAGRSGADTGLPPAACPQLQYRRCGVTLCNSTYSSSSCSLLQQPSRRPCFGSRLNIGSRRQNVTLQRMASCAGDTTLEVVTTEAEFDSAIRSHELVVVDFMARWCRKCIYLKPKLERMLREDFPDVRILFVDVNAVPSAVIKKSGVKKMPTIQLYKNGEQGPEHIAAEGAIDALEKIKLMVLRNTDLKLPQTT